MPLPTLLLTQRNEVANPLSAAQNDANLGNLETWFNVHLANELAAMNSAISSLQSGSLSTGRHTIPILAAGMTKRTTNGATLTSTETATNKNMIVTMDFSHLTNQYVQFAVPMNKSWNEGTIALQLGWFATSGTGVVKWGVQAVAISAGDALDAAWSSPVFVSPTLGTVSQMQTTAETAAITPAGAAAENDTLLVQIYRDVSVGSNLAATAKLAWAKMFISLNAGNDA